MYRPKKKEKIFSPFPRLEEKIHKALENILLVYARFMTALTRRKNPQDCSAKPPSKLILNLLFDFAFV